MTPSPAKAERHERLPPAIAGAALTAFAALYVTSGPRGHFIGLPILGALLLLSYVTSRRLPDSRWYGYGLRVLLFGSILLVVGMPSDDSSYWYFKPEYTNLGGYLMAAELVVQTWRWRDWRQPAEATGVALLLTVLVMAAATDTFMHRQTQNFALLYTLMVILSLRSLGAASRPPRRTLRLIILRGLLITFALALGYGSVEAITRYDYRITALAMRFLNRPDRQNEIGLSPTPQLGPVFNPRPSLDRVLLVDGPLPDPHLRAFAFDGFTHGLWLPPLRERQFVSIDSPRLGAGAAGDRVRITLLADTSGLLLAPLNSAGIEAPVPIDRDNQGVIQTHDPQTGVAYQIISPATFSFQGPLAAAPDDVMRQRYLMEPAELDPGVIELAQRVAGAGNPQERVRKLAKELRQTHAYSLTFSPHGEAINDFILNRRAAHCEYFASAMVVLARAVGVPARFVTGYYAHEHEGSHMVVRARDAHAWAECWIDGTGWIVVDATPSDGTPDALYPEPPRWRRWWEKIIDLPRLIREWIGRADRKTIAELAGGIVAGGMLVSFTRSLLSRRKQRRGRQRGYDAPEVEFVQSARRFERALRRRGIVISPHRTWRESIPTVPYSEVYLQFVAAYDAARFGAQGGAHRLRDLLDEVERQPVDNPE